MKRQYFLQFDYWTKKENKFYFGIVHEDLSSISLPEICRDIVDKKHEYIHVDNWTIKINAFNNIES